MLLNLKNLKHTYFAVRHGHSKPNEQGIIVTKSEIAVSDEYGLTEKGFEQARLSGKLFRLQTNIGPSNVIIIHSPFSRAKETAFTISEELGCKVFGVNNRLSERYFGDLDMTSDKGYQSVWEHDRLDPDSKFANAESPNEVLSRMLKVIEDCEKLDEEYGSNILLVGHADSIHILETAFRNIEVQFHRDIPYMRNGEIRGLN
jgi:glucosyl-3-phosphoglycerate phosphatase